MEVLVSRVALVTGSSHGLGRSIAWRLARDGFAVAVNGVAALGRYVVADAICAAGGLADDCVADAPTNASHQTGGRGG